MSPTALSLRLLRREGWQPAVVERWLPRINLRQDLWHFADVLACHPRERRFLVVQVSSLGNLAGRLAKVRGRPEAATWLAAGGAIEVHGWALRNGRWHCKRVGIRPEDLAAVVITAPPRQRAPSRWQQGELYA